MKRGIDTWKVTGMIRYVVLLLALYVFVTCISGCSIIGVLADPGSAPPENLTPGLSQQYVDTAYGQPVAAGMSGDGLEYAEQIRFFDGSSTDARVVRGALYTLLDIPTYLLAEIFLLTIEQSIQEKYPRYEYFIVYDDANRIVRAVGIDSPEGRMLSALPWAAPIPICIHENPNCEACKKMQGTALMECVHGNWICPHRRCRQVVKSPMCRLDPSERWRLRKDAEVSLRRQIVANMEENAKAKIEKLRRLKEFGVLTDEEYDEMVLRIIDQTK